MILQLEKRPANCAESGNESPENVLRWFLSCHKTDFTTMKPFLTQCYKLFTILRTYMIRFPGGRKKGSERRTNVAHITMEACTVNSLLFAQNLTGVPKCFDPDCLKLSFIE